MVKSKVGQKHLIMEEELLKDTSEKWMLMMVEKELMIVDKGNRMVVVVLTEDKD
jgi:predicted transcriptional regulator